MRRSRTRGLLCLAAVVLLAGCSQPAPQSTDSSTSQESRTASVGDVVGYYTIDEIHADRVEGRQMHPYPVATSGPGAPRTLRVGDEVGEACEGRTYVLSSIDAAAQRVTFTERLHEAAPHGCPICLSGDTSIDTPSGPVNVKELRAGMQVWALREGKRVAAPIEKVGQSATPPHHAMVHLVLDDGRELWASPGHPLTDARLVGRLAKGDTVDGASVSSVRPVAYDQPFTYDILAGEGYWANGILVASTLG